MVKEKTQDPTRHIRGAVFALVAVLAVALGALAVVQTHDIERGILEVCATQQDGYVQLVIDQINLKDNRDDEEIISDILETMDASSNKYWVFSQDQTMLFVKDVTETNRYKGFSANSYWGAEDAQAFLDTLAEGEVRHDFIQVGGIDYLASGSVFGYGGREYRLCLLTNRAALLDNNDYLGARSRLSVVMAVSLGLLVIVPMMLAFVIARERRRIAEQQRAIASLNARLREVSERLAHDDLYDNRRYVWSAEALEPFIQRILERGIEGAYLVQVVCDSADAAEDFMAQASIVLGDKVVRFSVSDEIVALLFPSGDPDGIRRSLASLLSARIEIGQVIPVEPTDEDARAGAFGSGAGSTHAQRRHSERSEEPPQAGTPETPRFARDDGQELGGWGARSAAEPRSSDQNPDSHDERK